MALKLCTKLYTLYTLYGRPRMDLPKWTPPEKERM